MLSSRIIYSTSVLEARSELSSGESESRVSQQDWVLRRSCVYVFPPNLIHKLCCGSKGESFRLVICIPRRQVFFLPDLLILTFILISIFFLCYSWRSVQENVCHIHANLQYWKFEPKKVSKPMFTNKKHHLKIRNLIERWCLKKFVIKSFW